MFLELRQVDRDVTKLLTPKPNATSFVGKNIIVPMSVSAQVRPDSPWLSNSRDFRKY